MSFQSKNSDKVTLKTIKNPKRPPLNLKFQEHTIDSRQLIDQYRVILTEPSEQLNQIHLPLQRLETEIDSPQLNTSQTSLRGFKSFLEIKQNNLDFLKHGLENSVADSLNLSKDSKTSLARSKRDLLDKELSYKKNIVEKLKNIGVEDFRSKQQSVQEIQHRQQKLLSQLGHVKSTPLFSKSLLVQQLKTNELEKFLNSQRNSNARRQQPAENFVQVRAEDTSLARKKAEAKSEHALPLRETGSNQTGDARLPKLGPKTSAGQNQIPRSNPVKALNLKDNLSEEDLYKVKWIDQGPQTRWNPGFREGATIQISKDDHTLYLYGGIGSQLYDTVESLDLREMSWQAPPKSSRPISPRTNHTMHLQESTKRLFVVGGESHYDATSQKRQLRNDVLQFDIQEARWTRLNCENSLLSARRNHASTLVLDQYIFVHGGFNLQYRTEGDAWIYQINRGKWSQCFLEDKRLALHQVCAVYYPSRKDSFQLYKPLEKNVAGGSAVIRTEGIYVFGGYPSTEQKQNSPPEKSTLWVIKTDEYPMKWTQPQTQGRAPETRWGHSMFLNRQLNALVIFGGAFELNRVHQYSNELFLLDLANLVWLQVLQQGPIPAPRSNFSCAQIGTRMVIFGGLNETGYMSNEVHIVELDQQKIFHKKPILKMHQQVKPSPHSQE